MSVDIEIHVNRHIPPYDNNKFVDVHESSCSIHNKSTHPKGDCLYYL